MANQRSCPTWIARDNDVSALRLCTGDHAYPVSVTDQRLHAVPFYTEARSSLAVTESSGEEVEGSSVCSFRRFQYHRRLPSTASAEWAAAVEIRADWVRSCLAAPLWAGYKDGADRGLRSRESSNPWRVLRSQLFTPSPFSLPSPGLRRYAAKRRGESSRSL